MELLNIRANDGSRQFAALPQTASWRKLRRHLGALAGVQLTEFLTDSVSEGWLDFTYAGQRFTVNDQVGQYWFFVDDPAAPDELLQHVAEHCNALLHAPAVQELLMPRDPAELTSAWFDAWRTKDANAIERMIAADYVYVAPNGAVIARDAIVAIIRDPSYGITDGSHSEVVVTPLGADVTLVRHHWQGRGTFRGLVFVDDHRCVMIWHRVASEWRVRYEQASPVAL